MGRQLEGKVGVVTGSTSGIGAAIAEGFAEAGASVVISGRREDRGEAVLKRIVDKGGKAVFYKTDVSQPEDCVAVCDAAHSAFGGLDILINNAGIFPRAKFEDTTPEFWDYVHAVNVRGAYLCSQEAVKFMRKRGGGSIINVGSAHPFHSARDTFAYACSKGELYTMTRILARGLVHDRIRVNWITVGWVITEKELEIQAAGGKTAFDLENKEKKLPMGEFNNEKEMADACVYLCGEAGKHITGTDLNVSAGLTVRI